MEAVLVHIWLREEAKLPTRRIREAREHFGGASGACRALKEGDPFFTPREREQGAKAVWEKAEQVLENCQKAGARAICLEEAEYPEALRQIVRSAGGALSAGHHAPVGGDAGPGHCGKAQGQPFGAGDCPPLCPGAVGPWLSHRFRPGPGCGWSGSPRGAGRSHSHGSCAGHGH